jgi:hypothetical protein
MDVERIFLPHDEPHSFVMTITPAIAARLLERNVCNRPLKTKKVAAWVDAMRAGKWRVNVGQVGIDRNGNLVDAQHRLTACVESGIPFDTFVAVGLDPASHETTDIGVKRSGSDALAVAGHAFCHRLASAAGLLWRYRAGKVASKIAPDNETILAVVRGNPALIDAVRSVDRYPKFVNRAVASVAIVVFAEDSPSLSSAFFSQLKKGAGLAEGHPVLALRNRLIAGDTQGAKKTGQVEQFALMVKAWNAAKARRSVKVLSWKSAGETPEAFPTIR